ncbi:response regulator [Salinigranum salinum]|uniref:response regulator n=1 Tax=Salinigranum salinum TaxID=1364937 RepID=UPI0012604B6D|nr:response regulator [Salinigranum salinum]
MTVGILLVDDSNYMRSRLKSALDDDEYEVVDEASNGAWAVQKYKEQTDDIDVVLMDIVMRKANGVKATAAIKHLDKDARVIMCTSVGQRKKMELAARAGADGYITKPFDDDEIVRAIRSILMSEA